MGTHLLNIYLCFWLKVMGGHCESTVILNRIFNLMKMLDWLHFNEEHLTRLWVCQLLLTLGFVMEAAWDYEGPGHLQPAWDHGGQAHLHLTWDHGGPAQLHPACVCTTVAWLCFSVQMECTSLGNENIDKRCWILSAQLENEKNNTISETSLDLGSNNKIKPFLGASNERLWKSYAALW